MTPRTLVLILLVLLLLGAFPAFSFGGALGGGVVGTLVLILLVLLIAKKV